MEDSMPTDGTLRYPDGSSITGLLIADAGSVLLYLTARRDEAECLAYFGQPYADYMKRTKGFIPGLL